MSRLLPLLALLAVTAAASAEDWPCWRGPRLDGTVIDDKVPLEWSKTDNVRWSVEVPGRGYSSPVVHGERIFLTTCDEAKLERRLLCLDRKTGKTLWSEVVLTSKLEGKHGLNSYASSTPATDGKHVYASFMGADNTMQAVCYTVDGKKVWQVEPGHLKSVHGFCSSPVLYKDMVILNGDQDAPRGRRRSSWPWRKRRARRNGGRTGPTRRGRIARRSSSTVRGVMTRPSWCCRAASASRATTPTRASCCGNTMAPRSSTWPASCRTRACCS